MTTAPFDVHGFDLFDFDLHAVEQDIAATMFAGHLQHIASVDSTNTLALVAAQSGARNGVWIADRQTAGRGRGSHSWHSAAGTPRGPFGLYMSALIAPRISIENALGLSLTTAIAVQSAIASTFGFRIRDQIDIRWPNDLLLNGRKCGGILIETASNPATPAQPATLRYAVIGIGVNLNHLVFPPELDPIATSLRRELPDPAQPLRREPLTAAILLALDERIRHLAASRSPQTADLAPFSSWIDGRHVRVEARDDDPGGYTGTTAGLTPSGFLLVRGDDGHLHTVLSGGLREP